MTQNPQNNISQTSLRYYNQFISVRTEHVIWLQTTKDIGKKLKAENEFRERYQQLLDFITPNIIKIEQ